MKSFLAWLRNVLIGPTCPHAECSYWARGDRSLYDHLDTKHAGDPA